MMAPRKSHSGVELPFRGYRLAEVLLVLAAITADDTGLWTWWKNSRCKYINLRIDTRDGGFVRIFDRDGHEITLDELKYQYNGRE